LTDLPEFGKSMSLQDCKNTCDRYRDRCKMFSFGNDTNNGNCWMKKDGDWHVTNYNNNFYRANDWKGKMVVSIGNIIWNAAQNISNRNYTNNVNNDAPWN